MELTDIYNARSIKDAARLKLARWFNEVEKLGVDNFYTVIDTFKTHYDTILNFFVNRATNANAESFNAKVKAFRAQFRGVTDIPFFLYRLILLSAKVFTSLYELGLTLLTRYQPFLLPLFLLLN